MVIVVDWLPKSLLSEVVRIKKSEILLLPSAKKSLMFNESLNFFS